MKERGILFSAPMVRALLDGSKTQTRRPMRVQPEDGETVTVERYHTIVRDKLGDDQPGVEIFGAWWADGECGMRCPFGEPGDRLWVRETWRTVAAADNLPPRELMAAHRIWYEATDTVAQPGHGKLRPSMFMPRWASRITLEITSVRVERLRDISEDDAVAEGCKADPYPGPWWQGYRRMTDGHLLHQQAIGEEPPDWMVEPHKMRSLAHLDRSAKDSYRMLWLSINGLESWDSNPWVWVVEFRSATPGQAQGGGKS